ncbi:MAG: T9SS type A sorting domain-containing protein [Bacteroidia bacterium]|nr:T9SS type A sorting domain-containing protein [Bacteroidia bacterium]
MKKYIPSLFAVFFLQVLSFGLVQAQHERLVPLGTNPVIKKYLHVHPASANKGMSSNDTLDIPFVDDFSASEVYPDQNLWTDRYVYVNDHFARNPVTIGVATFDGLDEFGNPYDNSASTIQGGCDTLTSKYINLLTKPQSAGGGQYTLADSITLSFYWQKKGLGDAPDSSDSLVVDFYNPSTNQWSRQWWLRGLISGGQDTVFTAVQICISNAIFLKDGFRFRFRNYGSRTGSLDHWHIDYIRLFKAYNQFSGQMDTTLLDVAMTQGGKSLMTEYTSVPWDHFTSLSSIDQANLLKDSSKMEYRVNDIVPADVGFNNRIYNFAGSYVAGFGADNGNIFPGRPQNQHLQYTFPVDSIFPNTPSLTVDSNRFTVLNYFTNGNAFSGLKSNDTVRFIQEFYNYYSLDDGSAEVGYDLINAPNGKIAMKFDIFKPDTLRAVRFNFVQQGANVSNKLFTIKVWSSLNPETLIYQESSQRPVYIDEINGYATYVLDQIVPVSGTIYVGFQQVLGDGLHLGFDRNTASNSRMFYNVGAGWIQTAITAGSFMVRPVMGDTNLFVGVPDLQIEAIAFQLAPNPAGDVVQLLVEDERNAEQVEVFAMDGRRIYCSSFTRYLNTSAFEPGFYLVRLNTESGQSFSRRLLISR